MNGKKYKVVGISSCSTGIAHTYMNAEAMTKQGKKYGIDVHIETQGQLGIENRLSDKDFAEADAIVICCGILPLEPERYEKYKDKTIKVNFAEIIKKPELFIKALKESGLIDRDLQIIK